jgi:hypothetical protein
MDLLTQLFVGHPQNILLVADLFFAGYCGQKLTKTTAIKRPRLLLVTAIMWILYAGWKWLIQTNNRKQISGWTFLSSGLYLLFFQHGLCFEFSGNFPLLYEKSQA